MYDVAGIGSALLDFTFQVDEDILEELGLKKGQMHLIDEDKSRDIQARMKNFPVEITPGGSAANTMAGVANLGGRSLFIGKVGRDAHGRIYIDESRKAGVEMRVNLHDKMTGHAITFITPDSERTFATHLGAALHFGREDVSADAIRSSKILHIEGYMLEGALKEASVFAMELAREAGVLISLDLADPALIQRNHAELTRLVADYADIVLVNEDEAKAFTGLEGERALHEIHSRCRVAVVKLGESGSLIKSEQGVHCVQPYKTEVVNTNGAGDMYAAGILFSLASGISLEKAGRISSYAASLVVGQVGARLKNRIDLSLLGD